MQVFHKDGDYAAFLKLTKQANERIQMRLLAYCLMPNHFHMVLWPINDGDLSDWMQWLTTAHVRRYHRHYKSSGHVWQGRFKSFPIQSDEHLLTVMRYVERNPVRAQPLPTLKSQDWPWSSVGIGYLVVAVVALQFDSMGIGKCDRDFTLSVGCFA